MPDPLFSTETTTVVHGGLDLSRPAKVAWLTANRPDLLPLLKGCFDGNRANNCGKCRKCIWTMLRLLAAGSLDGRRASRSASTCTACGRFASPTSSSDCGGCRPLTRSGPRAPPRSCGKGALRAAALGAPLVARAGSGAV